MNAAAPRCTRCGKSERICVCEGLEPVLTRTEVLILQHPQEPDRELGSATLAHCCLPNSTLRVGLSWPNLSAALGRPARPAEWMVLYLGSARPNPAGPRLVAVDRRGQPDLGRPPRGRGLVVLDGTWSQAKTLWWRNAWLLKLQRIILLPESPSLYAMLRREPRREAVSTLESLGLALGELEGRPEILEQLLRPFRKLLERCRLERRSG